MNMRLPQTASFQKFFATSLSSLLLVSPFAHGAVPAIYWGSPDHDGSDEHFSSDGSVLSATAIAADDTYIFELGYFSESFDPNVTEVEDWSDHWTIVDKEDYKITGGNG